MIYLCRNKRNGFVKVGFSRTPDLREKTLQAEDPELFFEHTFPGTTLDGESAIHRKYAHRRLRGEWFELTPEDVLDICRQLRDGEDQELAETRDSVVEYLYQCVGKLTDAQCETLHHGMTEMVAGNDVRFYTEAQIGYREAEAVRCHCRDVIEKLQPVVEWLDEKQRIPF